MSAINPIINLQPPADTAANSPSSSRTDADNGPSAFSQALSGTEDRPPPRKSASRHRSDDSGANLPASGNAPPTAAVPPPPPAAPAPQAKDAPATRNVTDPANAATAPAAATPATAKVTATAASAGAAAGAGATDPAAAKAAADAAAAAAQVAAGVALPGATVADPGTTALSESPAPVTADTKTPTADGNTVTTAPAAVAVVKTAAPAGPAAGTAAVSAASSGTSAPNSTTAPGASGTAANPAAAVAAPATTPQPAADPAVAALLAQATTAATDAGATKPSDSRVVDATLQAPDSQSPAVGDAAGLAGANAAAPAFAATLAGAAEIASAVAGTSADKHDRSTPDTLAPDAIAAAGQQAPVSTAQTDAATPVLKVPSSVDSPDFAQNVASQVSVMVDSKLTSAKLQVSPPSLGPIEVRIAIQGDHAQVSFSSHSALTRDALESSSPHLREMLGAQGFAQVSVDISHRSFQERTPTPPSYDWSVGSERGSGGGDVSVSASAARSNNGLLDAYA